MFQSYQDLYTECQSLSSDDNSSTLTLFKKWLNKGISKAYAQLNAEWFYESVLYTTVDGDFSYPLPYNCQKIHSIKVVDSNDYPYVATEFPGSETEWDTLMDGSTEGEYPQYFFVKRNTFEIYPISATSALDMTVKYKVRKKELSADDYVTSSIKTATFGSTAIVGNAPTWTSAMVGRYLKITGDGDWYEISDIPTATTMTLAREYAGEAIVAGTTAYTIGEMSLLPEDSQDLPLQFAMWMYYRTKKDLQSANDYKASWLEGLQELRGASNLTTSGLIGEEVVIVDPNSNPTLS
jgi:hypothetical protein